MLDDFPLDEDLAFPISPVNSVLDTLSSLHRPSPSPTPSKLEFTWSSGDIPVILYDNAYIDERVSGLVISGDNKRESVVTLVDDSNHCFSHHSPTFSTRSRASLLDRHRDSVVISSSESSDTIRSAATFGPRKHPATETWHSSSFQRFSQPAGNQSPQMLGSTIVEGGGTGRAELDNTSFSQSKVLHSVLNHSDSSPGYDKQRLNIGEWYSVPSIERAGTPSSESTYGEPPSSATRASILSEGSEGGPGASDIKRSPSAQSWFSVSEWNHNDYSALEPTSEPLKRTRPAFNDATESGIPPYPIESNQETVQDHHEVSSPFENPPSAIYRFDTFLRATSVQFLIDQEGFRDAEPSFKYCGISRVRSSRENSSQDRTMAQFRPVSRQQFHFHHAPFETPPVLRRINVNNDDTSDYVSRQAHLTLKSNGVYVIHGHEVLSAAHASEQTKLYWQFEYLVDDRRVESSGSRRDLEGEKTFTPLTFSCSPRLLLPSQAKRVNIMHVFKKSLAPKLVAEKLQVRLGTQRSASNPSLEKTLTAKAPHARSSRSHDRRSHGAEDDAPNKRAVGARASVIGPLSETQIAYGTDAGHTTQPLSRLTTHEAVAKDRHIVPPARLSELLIRDSSSKEDHAPAPGIRTSVLDTRQRDSKAFVALSPRPKQPASLKIR